MSPSAVVIVPLDRQLDLCLDPVSAQLRAAGFEVLRPLAPVPAGWRDELARADVVVLTPRTPLARPELAAAPRIKGVVFPTIGVEALDLTAATELGIAVGFGATAAAVDSVAEANVTLIAALLLDLAGKERALRERGWRDGAVAGRMVQGKTIGFLGFGRIARATLHRLAHWGVRAQFYDPYAGDAADGAAVRLDDLASLMRTSDVVVVQSELTRETQGMIGEAELRMMRPDAFLVNTARGAIVDEAALYRALRERWIAGAALDTFSTEPLPAESPLRLLDNVRLTPHSVGHTAELQASFVPAAFENIVRIARGEPPLYFKNRQVLEVWQARLARIAAT